MVKLERELMDGFFRGATIFAWLSHEEGVYMTRECSNDLAWRKPGGIPEVAICDMDSRTQLLTGVNGCVYREINTNIWVNALEYDGVAYLGTGRHGGGIILRPLFVESDGKWLNASTGAEAPRDLAESFKSVMQHGGSCEKTSQQVGAAEGADSIRVHEGLSWRERCELLAEISETFAWAAQLKNVYQRLCEAISEAFKCNEVHLHLLNSDGDRLIKRAYCSERPYPQRQEDALKVTVGRCMWMMETSKPIIMDYEHPHREDEIPKEALELGIRSAVSIPLMAGSLCVGMLSLTYRAKTEWTEEDCEFLTLVGRIVGSHIKRLLDTKKAGELQILNERKLLSAEIHDNVSSLLSALSINAAAAMASLEENDEDMAREDLERLERLTGETLRILRDEMLSLRISLEETDGLIEGIEDSLTLFEKNWGIQTELVISGPCQPVVVPTHASLQMTRILNECLSNTLRHAYATKVLVTIESDASAVTMKVQDDGCGFDVDAVGSDHYGLKIMRERAYATGGHIRIESSENGTAVTVVVPRVRKVQEIRIKG